jgi:hypothetical protein
MSDQSITSIALSPEMSAIIERLRGKLSPKRFLYTLLKIADSGAVSSPPPSFSEVIPPSSAASPKKKHRPAKEGAKKSKRGKARKI